MIQGVAEGSIHEADIIIMILSPDYMSPVTDYRL